MKTRTKSKKVNKAWLHDHMNDTYVKLAQKDGYRARAAYKLKEIDEALGLVKPGMVIVDLGAAPGAWSQYLRRRLGHLGGATDGVAPLNGVILALDVLPMEPVDGVEILLGDFHEEAVAAELSRRLAGRPVDLVVSDMAPNLSGIESSDSARMAHLVELAMDFAGQHLKPGGALVCKAFHGSGYSQTVEQMKRRFRIVKPI
jgi:23S rRNA (uridine2552-2'-O)-methyltransferase